MSYTPEQLARLSKWAQKEIERNEREIANLKARIEELNRQHPGSNIELGNYVYGDSTLPPDSEIGFYLGEPPYQKYRNMISVQHIGTKHRNVLRVTAHSGSLVIKPSGGINVIELTVEES